MPAAVPHEELENAQYITSACALIVGAICSYVGLWSAYTARKRRCGYDAKVHNLAWQLLMARMPSTVSENVHDAETAHGTTFKAMMLVLALMCMTSQFPGYDICGFYPIGGGFIYAFRLFAPTVGIFFLVMVPSNKDVLSMMAQEFTSEQPISDKQRYDYIMSEVQDGIHRVGGFIGMALTTILECCNVIYTLKYFYFQDHSVTSAVTLDSLPHFVSFRDNTLASTMWFVLACARLFVCIVIVPTLARYVYETGMRKDQRCRWLKPDYSYLPETYSIHQLTSYLLLTGLSILFVRHKIFDQFGPRSQIFAAVISILAIVVIFVQLLRQIWFLIRINTYLSDINMEVKIKKYIKEYELSVKDDSKQMQRLVALRDLALKRNRDNARPNSDRNATPDATLLVGESTVTSTSRRH